MKTYESVVVGAGPAGLTAALYLCNFGLHVALVEKLTPGGQMLNTYEIGNYLGFPEGTPGYSLADTFYAHLKQRDLDHYTKRVESLNYDGRNHLIEFPDETIAARTVIICTGAIPKMLGLPDEERLTGHGVSYCAMCDGMLYRNKTVAMVGGGNAALEEALHLSNLVGKLYLIHRRDRFRADKVYQDKLTHRADKVEFLLSHGVTALHGMTHLTGITVEPVHGGGPREIDVEGLFIFVGTRPAGHFLSENVRKDQYGFIETDAEMRTEVPGLFAAGDIRSKQCRQVVTAAGDGATAAFSAFAYLETLAD